MKGDQTALERAFELAKSGKCSSTKEIRKILAKEGYSQVQLTGRALRDQLGELIRKSKTPKIDLMHFAPECASPPHRTSH